MKVVKGIGFYIPSVEDDFIKINSFSSLADTDIAIFSPDISTASYSTYDSKDFSAGLYEGKKLYNRESSVLLKEHCKHWRRELDHFLERGGTLFVIMSKKEDFYIYSGTKDISGTGRSQKTTYHVVPFSNYEFLPFSNIEYQVATGKTIIPQSSLVKDLYSQFKELFSFEIYIKSKSSFNGIFTTKNGGSNLGIVTKIKEGNLILLPNLHFNDDRFAKFDKKTKEEGWTEEAIKLGKIFVNCLVAIDKTLLNEKLITPKPSWLEDSLFELSDSNNTKNQILKIEKEIDKRNKELINLNSVLEEQESLKDLLYETGNPLEVAVIKALRILGFTAENYDDGELELDQIIISPEGARYIGECEGKDNKDIDVTKFRQLLDGLNADFEKDHVEEKATGLLFGNSQRLTNPDDRNLDFTQKCKIGAKREGIGLIKTTDLFKVCKAILEGNDQGYAKKCREAISEQLGFVVKFPEYEK